MNAPIPQDWSVRVYGIGEISGNHELRENEAMKGKRVRVIGGDDSRIIGLIGVIEKVVVGNIVEFRSDDGRLWRTYFSLCVEIESKGETS